MNIKDTLHNDIAPDIHQEQYGPNDGKLLVYQEHHEIGPPAMQTWIECKNPVEVKR